MIEQLPDCKIKQKEIIIMHSQSEQQQKVSNMKTGLVFKSKSYASKIR